MEGLRLPPWRTAALACVSGISKVGYEGTEDGARYTRVAKRSVSVTAR